MKSTDLLPETVFEANSEGIITYINQAGCELLGYTREELGCMTFFDFVVPEMQQAAREGFCLAVKRKATGPSITADIPMT